ncbi:MAG: hypothetical protein WAL66_03810 [Nitrososphaeraceae archaeon]
MKNEFLAIEDIPSTDDGKQRYDSMFVKAYTETREHGGINGLTPPEMFVEGLVTSTALLHNSERSSSCNAFSTSQE